MAFWLSPEVSTWDPIISLRALAQGLIILFVWFDSLRPLNNLSVMRDGIPGLNQY